MGDVVRLDGVSLTRAQLVRVAHGAQVALDAKALERVAHAAEFLLQQVAKQEPIYGISTGFGSNADKLLGIALLLFIVKLGLMAGANMQALRQVGWALAFQELGHAFGTMVLALPLVLTDAGGVLGRLKLLFSLGLGARLGLAPSRAPAWLGARLTGWLAPGCSLRG